MRQSCCVVCCRLPHKELSACHQGSGKWCRGPKEIWGEDGGEDMPRWRAGLCSCGAGGVRACTATTSSLPPASSSAADARTAQPEHCSARAEAEQSSRKLLHTAVPGTGKGPEGNHIRAWMFLPRGWARQAWCLMWEGKPESKRSQSPRSTKVRQRGECPWARREPWAHLWPLQQWD